MTELIAVAGKGGTGKTTFCALTIRYLIKNGLVPVLAIDADANLNLNEVLGLEIEQTIGGIRDELKEDLGIIPQGMAKETWIEMQLQDAIIEATKFDLVAMGKPEGTGCYCYVNSVLQRYVEVLAKNYPYIVMDNEAGMEHISRGTTKDVSYLMIVSDASPRGVRTAARIRDLVTDLRIKVGQMFLVLNRLADEETTTQALEAAKKENLEVVGVIPNDLLIVQFDRDDRSLLELPDDSLAVIAVKEILEKITGKDVPSLESQVAS